MGGDGGAAKKSPGHRFYTRLNALECPFDLYRRARDEMPVFYSERFDLWVVTRYDDIVRILKDPATFSSAQSLAVDMAVAPEVQAVLDTGYPATPTMVTADPPVHTRFRELVGKAFTSRRVAAHRTV